MIPPRQGGIIENLQQKFVRSAHVSLSRSQTTQLFKKVMNLCMFRIRLQFCIGATLVSSAVLTAAMKTLWKSLTRRLPTEMDSAVTVATPRGQRELR